MTAEDLIEQIESGRDDGRKVYRITDKGRQSLDAFVLEPPTDVPRPLRQELSAKLLFATPNRLEDVLRVVSHQRSEYLRHLHALGVQRAKIARLSGDHSVTQLLIDGAELHARAEIAWLDDVTQRLKSRREPPA